MTRSGICLKVAGQSEVSEGIRRLLIVTLMRRETLMEILRRSVVNEVWAAWYPGSEDFGNGRISTGTPKMDAFSGNLLIKIV